VKSAESRAGRLEGAVGVELHKIALDDLDQSRGETKSIR